MKQEIAVRLLVVLGVLFALAAAGVLAQWASRGRTSAQSRMATRFAVEVGMLAAIWGPAYLGGPWLLGAAALLLVLCSRELYGTLEVAGGRPWKLPGLGLGLVALFVVHDRPEAVGWMFPAALTLYAGLWGLARGRLPDSLPSRAERTALGFLYPSLCVAVFLSLGLGEAGFGYAVFFYGVAEANDVFAYLVGSSIGRRKIFPRLSPNKTLEGVAGGVLGAIAVAFAFSFAVPEFGPWRVLAAGGLIACAGLCGDLFASHLKRRAGLKDYGNLIPTQGGVLDLYDAFLFAAPVFYAYLHWTAA